MKEDPENMNLSTEQFEKLLSAIGSQRRRSFAACTVVYTGTRDTEAVETFLAGATVYKSIELINDEEAIRSVPLILKDEAATWWNGIKTEITTWTEFQNRLRLAFAPKRPPYQIYQDIIGIRQGSDELTETFVMKKRALFAQLPESHSETQQLDMLYGQVKYEIRVKLARETVKTFDEFLKAARTVERLLTEKQAQAQMQPTTSKNAAWKWTDEQEKAFQELKTRLTTAPILRQADETKPYTIKTDASNFALGAVLVQGEGEDERPVEFASRLLNPAEKNYSITARSWTWPASQDRRLTQPS